MYITIPRAVKDHIKIHHIKLSTKNVQNNLKEESKEERGELKQREKKTENK